MQLSKKKQNITNILPQTHSQVRNQSPSIVKKFEAVLVNKKVILTYISNPIPTLNIKALHLVSFTVCQIQLTPQLLQQMDSSVLATFDTLQGMYNQFAQIIKSTPNDFQISEVGMIKIKITVAMKSGIKKKDLILETQLRQMNEVQKLKLEMDAQQQNNLTHIKQLKEYSNKLEKQLIQCKKQNKQLKQLIMELKKQMKAQVQQIKVKVNKQRQLTQDLLQQLRQNVNLIKQNMNKMQYSLKIISGGAKKIILVPDKNSKCFKIGHKQNSFNISVINQINQQAIKLTKIGKQQWTQILFEYCIAPPISYFQLQITKTKNNYICIGVCSKNCQDQLDCKWSKQSITLFLLDNSIIAEGKQLKNKLPTNQNQSSVYSSNISNYNSKNKKQHQTKKIRVVINCINKNIEWYENQVLSRQASFSQQFFNLCKNLLIKPIIICVDQEDEIIVR